MARSTYIYLVSQVDIGRVIGAFTVKHELVTALAKLGRTVNPKSLDVDGPYDIVRVRDGALS